MPQRSFIWKIPAKDFKQAITECTSWSAVARRYCTNVGNVHILQSRARQDGLDTSHFLGRSWSKGQKCAQNSHPKYKLNELLVVGKHTIGNQRLKKRLLAEKLVKDQCYTCGLDPVWNGRPLNLHLSHLNGNKYDNRLENLTLLCPNCYSQSKLEQKYAKLVFLRTCEGCDKDIPDEEELCKRCKRRKRRPSSGDLARELTAIGIDGVKRKYNTEENVIKTWLDSP